MMTTARRVRVLAAMVGFVAALACGGGGTVAEPEVVTPPPAPPDDVVTDAGPLAPDCTGFCRHTGECWTQQGKTLGPDEQDCATSCIQPGGTYVHMGPTAFLCATVACGHAFDDCSGNALAAVISAGMAGAPLDPPPGYPADFPMFYGGRLVPTGPTGPMTAIVFDFAPLPPAELAKAVRAEIVRTGWALDAGEAASEPGTSDHVRMQATRAGNAVSVSVYALEGMTVLQLGVMQGAAEEPAKAKTKTKAGKVKAKAKARGEQY